ncbi:protein SCAR1-like [Salvia splendens]|uniref:protein SCAR1-like n=1 Tax=Salvia splendens TaxID=180675 RepID=UPI001C2515A8|nr:protein SCAR1-like [Salvia splendens]
MSSSARQYSALLIYHMYVYARPHTHTHQIFAISAVELVQSPTYLPLSFTRISLSLLSDRFIRPSIYPPQFLAHSFICCSGDIVPQSERENFQFLCCYSSLSLFVCETMPLARVEVRNQYRLGTPEMYIEANNDEPKDILQGVAVAGLVGLLRQLGDLADFAAEVFHGLQEEVVVTCSRSRELMARVLRIEAKVVPVEKNVLAQQNHLHLAYTAGLNWQTPARYEQNLFVYSDMPQFILDFYENCRSPPQFHLLDRFDPGGPGSCLKRYSDPTIYSFASKAPGDASNGKVEKFNKSEKSEKQSPCPRNGEVSRNASFAYLISRMQSPSNVGRNTSPCQPTDYSALKSGMCEHSNSHKRNELGCSKDEICSSYSMKTKEEKSRGLSAQMTGDYLNPIKAKSIGSRVGNSQENCAMLHGRNEDPCSSPPLSHMKISVQPIGGFVNSKKKPKFMRGIIDHGSIDALPSFQLVPEVSSTGLNVASDSDDETFRATSPSLSDGSESSPEQFESRIENQPFQYEPEFATAPDLPPLPPVQWWVSEKSHDTMPQMSNNAFDLMHAASSNSQHKPAPLNHDQDSETANEQKSKPFYSEKSDAEGEAKGDKNIDENNFLNQIRTKLMSLRPTEPSGTSTNVQGMTILDKANAIRKAIGSDDE